MAGANASETRTGKLLASYQLGYFTQTLRYCVEYMKCYSYPPDPRVVKGQMLFSWAQWTSEAYEKLAVEISLYPPARRIGTILLDLQRSQGLEAAQRPPHDGWPNLIPEAGLPSNVQQWSDELEMVSSAALNKFPKLYPWYNLGRVIGMLFDDLLIEKRNEPIPRFAELRNAAIECPTKQRARVPALAFLAATTRGELENAGGLKLLTLALGDQFSPADPITDTSHLASLYERFASKTPSTAAEARGTLVTIDEEPLGDHLPNIIAVHKVHELNKQLTAGIESIPDPHSVFLDVDAADPELMIDGKPVRVTRYQSLCLKAILDAGGETITSEEIKSAFRELKTVDVAGQIRRFAPPVKTLLHPSRRGHHGGYRALT